MFFERKSQHLEFRKLFLKFSGGFYYEIRGFVDG